MLAGLMSQWMTPRSWACWSAAATWRAQRAGQADRHRPPAPHQPPQVGAVGELQYQVVGAPHSSGVVSGDDVRVTQSRQARASQRTNSAAAALAVGLERPNTLTATTRSMSVCVARNTQANPPRPR